MATLWGGRFTEKTDELVKAFNDSISFDRRLWEVDIKGSIVHADMLGKVGVISGEESVEIQKTLQDILNEIKEGRLIISEEYEDIHSFVEATLTDRIGAAGKKLHTGRSRNDQVALDMKLYTRDRIDATRAHLTELLDVLLSVMKEHRDSIMPGFTHMQKAQPTTLGHHVGAYFEMFYRDVLRLDDVRTRLNYSPLGAGALCGTTYPLDREYVADRLGFAAATENSMDSVSDRDYLIEYISALSIVMMHLSRFCEEIIAWNSNEYGFIELSDAYSTGSSIMPQKKNPDVAELIRGKSGRVYGALFSLLTTMKALPLAYNKDMQEDKEAAFNAFDTVDDCIRLFSGMIKSADFNKHKMEASAKMGYTNATDVADYLVKKGMPFRDAHSVVGRIVVYCIDRKKSIEDVPLLKLREFSDIIESDIYEEIALDVVVKKRITKGAPGKEAMNAQIESAKERLKALRGKDGK